MRRRVRKILFGASAAGLTLVFWLGYGDLAPYGQGRSVYARMVNALSVPERHMTDAVTAVNFDIRGFDTLGEEFILFTSVMGIVLLMRKTGSEEKGRHEDAAEDRNIPPVSDAMRVTGLLLLAPTGVFGWYIVTHGQVTPGGGFQGGVILASAALLIYLCSGFPQFRKASPPRLVELAEAVGAAGYIAIGTACVVLGGLFLQNLLPLGENGTLTAGGTVPFIELAVGLEVAGGFVLTLLVYLQELMQEKEQ